MRYCKFTLHDSNNTPVYVNPNLVTRITTHLETTYIYFNGTGASGNCDLIGVQEPMHHVVADLSGLL